MGPSDLPESLTAVFDLPVEEKVETRPTPTKELPKFHDEKLSYAFAAPGLDSPEGKCWQKATNEGIEKPVIYNEIKKVKKRKKKSPFDFKDF